MRRDETAWLLVSQPSSALRSPSLCPYVQPLVLFRAFLHSALLCSALVRLLPCACAAFQTRHTTSAPRYWNTHVYIMIVAIIVFIETIYTIA